MSGVAFADVDDLGLFEPEEIPVPPPAPLALTLPQNLLAMQERASSVEQVRWMLSDSRAVTSFVETSAHAEMIEALRPDLPELGRVWQFDGDAFAELTSAGADVPDSGA